VRNPSDRREDSLAGRPVQAGRAALRAGLVATLPLAPGVMAFALVYGLTARQVGLSPGQAWLMSLTVFAGAAQFSALQVWATASAGMLILITLIVNLRYLLMSASIAPYLQGLPWYLKAPAAFMLSDESYALGMARYATGHGSFAYLIGANLGLYAEWTVASLGGAWLGAALPDLSLYRLDLVFPLAFLGLLVPLISDRITLTAALVAGVLALSGAALLPGKWYILIAGLGASTAGVMLENLWKQR
jgi:predicted branched-subunit amino acid permease